MPESGDDKLLGLFRQLRNTTYASLRAEVEIDRSFLTGDFTDNFIPDDWMDDGMEPIALSTGYDAVENAADHILDQVRIFVPARPSSENHEEMQTAAERIRRACNLFWQRVRVDQGHPLHASKKSLIMGRTVFKKTIDWDLLPDPDEVGMEAFGKALKQVSKSEFLWNVSTPPPLTVYEDPTRPHDPRYVYEAYKITKLEAEEMVDTTPNFSPSTQLSDQLKGMEALDTLDFVEYYSKPRLKSQGEHIIWIGDDRVLDAKNPYSWESPASTEDNKLYTGYVPYFIGEPGWGYADENNRPEDRFVGILRPLRSTLTAESRQMTEIESWVRTYVWPIMLAQNLKMEDEEGNVIQLGPGAVLETTDEGQDLRVVNFGEAPATAMQHLQNLARKANESSKFGSLGGSPQRGVDTATEADLNTRNAATKLGGPVTTLERLIGRMTQTFLQDIEHVLEHEVTLYGATRVGSGEITLGPRAINGYHNVFVELTTSDKEALRARDMRLAADFYRLNPDYSSRSAMEQAGIDNPQEEADQRRIEDLSRNPIFQNLEVMVALEGLGETGQLIQQAMTRLIESGQIPGLEGPPPNPAASDANALTTNAGGGAPNPAQVQGRELTAQQPQAQFN